MGHSRPRYNQKGRAIGREKGKKRTRTEGEGDGPQDDSNALVIDPLQRKRKRDELVNSHLGTSDHEPKMSAKKKKRLDAFIERKLKKEQRKDLIASLAQTQTQSLNFTSSSSLGSRQFLSQASKLSHASAVEQSRRDRAQKILQRANAGKMHLSDEEEEEDGEEEEVRDERGEEEERELEREFVKPQQALALTTAAPASAKKHTQPFNPSGAVGVVESPSQPIASTSSTPAPAPAVGSALASSATVTVVKRKPKEKGRMRALVEKAKGKGKGKGKQEEVESEESEFDSSEESEGEEEGGEEEWGGIEIDGEEEGRDAESGQAEEGEGIAEDSGGGDEDEDDDESEEEQDGVRRPPRERGSFRAWADAQVLTAAGLDSSTSTTAEDDDGTYKPLLPAGSGVAPAALPEGTTGPLGASLPASDLPTLPPQRTIHVPVTRTPEIEAQRAELPVVKEEDRVMAAIRGNAVVVICGETGSGKTTQIGQFLWEAGFGDSKSDNPGMVAITQPRRVAALSTSARVRTELNLPSTSSLVAHRIRYSSTTSAGTKLLFMTDGVLLRELAADFLLSKYSVVVVDEAHERGVNTDVLIGVLSRVAKLREKQWKAGKEGAKPLRLVIMSATLRVADFAENPTLFAQPPPVLHITARQHPVTLHFARRTAHDYLEQAYKKVARIHARLPPGGVLVFCTGQNEIVSLVKRLEKKFGPKAVQARKERLKRAAVRGAGRDGRSAGDGDEDEEAEREVEDLKLRGGKVEMGDDLEAEEVDLGEGRDLAADVDDGVYDVDEEDEEALESDMDGDDETFKGIDMEEDTDEPMHILPLYSLLPTEKQMKVFQPPPEGHRLVAVATNVAETAITIPNIKYVVDTGRAKERKYDHASGIQSFEVDWISKASAAQRAGRAGRTGPGHCYRLYSSAVFEQHFDQFAKPEILRMPIEGIVLTMKSMNIDAVANFPFPTPPDRDALRRAEKTLVHLGALEPAEVDSKVGGKITPLGRSMALFPLSPRFSKLIVAGQQHGCLPYVIAIVCALSVGDPFIREANLGDDEESADAVDDAEKTLTRAEIAHIRDPEIKAKEERKLLRKAFFQVQQRYAALGKGTSDVFKLLSVVGAYEYEGGRESFCEANFVRTKAMEEIHKLRAQISRIVSSTFPGIDAGFVPKLPPPNETQLKVLRQLLTAAFIDQVAIRKDLADKSSNLSYAKVASTRGVPYRAFGIEEDLFIHPSSNLFHGPPPEFIVFNELHRTHKVWLKTITKVNPAWLPVLGRPMCTFSKPIETPAQAIAAKAASSALSGDTRQIFVVPRFGPGVGVELKPIQMTQKLVNGRWVLQ
ncbi:putative ATP-dependent RNA helicase DHR1 [Rhodotorula toruloides]